MRLNSRLSRLEAIETLISTETPAEDAEAKLAETVKPYLAHPEGPALVAEMSSIVMRVMRGLPPRSHLHLLRQGLLADERGREIMVQLTEIAGGLGFDSGTPQ